jgi:hypothetical protein
MLTLLIAGKAVSALETLARFLVSAFRHFVCRMDRSASVSVSRISLSTGFPAVRTQF